MTSTDREYSRELEKQKKGLRSAYQAKDLKEAGSFCNSIGVLYSQAGHYEEALRYHREELQLCDSLQDKLGIAVAHRKIGECMADLCNFREALKHQQTYLELARSLANMEEIQRAYTTIGRVWYMRIMSDENGDHKHALKCARDAYLAGLSSCDELEVLSTVSRKELAEMRARLYLNLGLLAETEGDNKAAQNHYEGATRIGRDANDHTLMWKSQLNLGDLLLNQNKHEHALAVYKDSLQHAVAGNSKENKAESLLKIAMLHVNQINFPLARQHLRAAFKLDCHVGDDDQDAVILLYKAVCKIFRLERRALQPSLSAQDRLKVYEQMGDLCSRSCVGFFNAAVHYYLKQLDIATSHGMEPKEVSKILFSIAETLVDKKQYNEAMSYYQKELDMCEQPEESALTLTKIARLHETAQHSSSTVMDAYMKAIEMAKTAQNHSLQASLYNSTLEYLDDQDMDIERERVQSELQTLLQHHPEAASLVHSADSNHTLVLNSNDILEDLELSPTTDEDEEDDLLGVLEPYCVQPQQQRGVALRKRSKVMKRNEKGETPLHVAVINGNFARVRQLVRDGADLAVRDHCGWTPLHEACNHGHIDITRCLVEAGANVNDQGGPDCNGLTPLMDAACNGHLEVVTMLVDNGALLELMNVNGRTALDLVKERLASLGRDEQLIAIRDFLKQEMLSRGICVGRSRHSTVPTRLSSTSISSSQPALICSSSEEDSPRQRPVAIVSPIRRITTQTAEQPIPALVSDNFTDECTSQLQHPVVDNWLVDDMGAPPTKKRRHVSSSRSIMPTQRVRSIQATQSTRSSGAGGRRQQRTADTAKRKNGKECGIITVGSDSDEVSELEDIGDIGEVGDRFSCPADDPVVEISSASFSTVQEMNDNVPLLPTFQQMPFSTQSTYAEQPIRVQVLIEKEHYLIPCPRLLDDGNSTTVEWLADKVIDRYFCQYCRQPVLHLVTSEGALLASSDTLVDVVKEGEKVMAMVDRWENPPLSECYNSACTRMRCEIHQRVLLLFESSVTPTSLDLSDFGIQSKHCPALFHSLMSQTSLTSLCLSGNRLLDSAMKSLAFAIPHLASLVTLDLTCTGITGKGLTTLAQAHLATPNSSSPPHLQRLALSYNHLGETCGSSLVSIITQFPTLSYLYLERCGLTAYVFQPHTGLLGALKGLTGLLELSLSCNLIGVEGWQLLISALADLSLLNLSSTTNSSSSTSIPTASCLTQLGTSLPMLTHLDLSRCNLGDAGISQLASSLSLLIKLTNLLLSVNKLSCNGIHTLTRSLQDCSSLRVFDVSGNPFGNDGYLAVLLFCASHASLKELRVAACEVTSPLPPTLWDVHCGLQHLDLSDNELSCGDRDKICQWWGGNAIVHSRVLLLDASQCGHALL